MEIYINDIKYPVMQDSFQAEDEIESRATLSFVVKDIRNEYTFEKGMRVRVMNEGDHIYSGYIDTSNKVPITNVNNYVHEIQCVDMHYLADKRRISYSAQKKLSGNVVQDMVDLKLIEEGVWYDVDYDLTQTVDLNRTLDLNYNFDLDDYFYKFLDYIFGIDNTVDSIDDGEEIKETRVNFVPVSQALNSLAEKTGYWWKIDQDQKIHFRDYASEPAPFDLTRSDIRGKPTVKTGNPLYRNQQIVRGGIGITSEQVDVEKGDGEKRAFPVSFAIAKEPTIEVDRGTGFVAKNVEIKGNDNAEWYWEPESDTIAQDKAQTVLSSTDRVRCTYIGQFKIVALTQDPGEVSLQADIDGTSGIIEDAIDVGNVEGREAAIEEGNAKLKRYAKNSTTLNFTTRNEGLKAGQLLTVQGLSQLGIPENEKLLVTKVEIYDEQGILFYEVEAVKGPRHRTWEQFFGELSQRASLVVREGIGESEILVIPISFSKTWTETEDPNIFTEVYPSDTLYPANDLYPMFMPSNRVKYLAWYDGTTELGRQEFTQQDGADSNEIFTLTYLGPNSANATITDFGWIGGYYATESGGGIQVDKQAYSITKTEDEALQIEKTDTKGW